MPLPWKQKQQQCPVVRKYFPGLCRHRLGASQKSSGKTVPPKSPPGAGAVAGDDEGKKSPKAGGASAAGAGRGRGRGAKGGRGGRGGRSPGRGGDGAGAGGGGNSFAALGE